MVQTEQETSTVTTTKKRAEPQQAKTPPVVIDRLEIPVGGSGQVVQRAGYTLCYNEEAEQPAWVAYVLTRAELSAAHVPRANRFLEDPQIRSGSATDADYDHSGYDRGHLAPAEDQSYSGITMKESFYYSNMSPQLPAFNRGVWKRLEELVRYWATTYDSLFIVTGPVLQPGLPAIGPNGVAVPASYYKVVLRYRNGSRQAIGFVVPHAASAASLGSFAMPVNAVEALTKIDFFPSLPDAEEEALERAADREAWQWTRSKN